LGLKLISMPGNNAASGQAAAKAMRAQVAVAEVRAAIFIIRIRRVVKRDGGKRMLPGDDVAHRQRQPIEGGVRPALRHATFTDSILRSRPGRATGSQ
jgi:hypothetical protein